MVVSDFDGYNVIIRRKVKTLKVAQVEPMQNVARNALK